MTTATEPTVDRRDLTTASPPAHRQRVASGRAAMLAAALVPFLIVGALTFANTSDDPLITMRYAFNLLHHGQPVFNLGERVEGYTSPLHMLLAAALILLPGGLVLLKLKLASLVFAGGALWQTNRLSRTVGLPRWAQLATMVGVAGSWNFVTSASNGLETSLVAFLATGAVASLGAQDAAERWWRPAIWTGLLAVSRPDVVLIIAGLALVSLRRDRSRPWRARIAWLAGPGLTLAALLIFRVAYFGQLVPNTYFAKQIGLGGALADGWTYLVTSQPLSEARVGYGILVLALQAILILICVRQVRRRVPAVQYALAVIGAQLILIVVSGGDWMKGGRFLAPAIPVAGVLAFSGLAALLTMVSRGRTPPVHRRHLAVIAVVSVLTAPVSGSYLAPIWSLAHGVTNRGLIADGHYDFSFVWAESADLPDCLRAGQSVAFSEVGLLGYEHPRLRLIDTRGLTNADIARHAPSADKSDIGVLDPQAYRAGSPVGRVLVRRRPDMIASFDFSRRSTILNGTYRLVRAMTGPAPDERLLVYLRAGELPRTCGQP